jgi:3-phenylpropionate/cinnamic acid dioxygenase small subunit
MSAPSGHVAVPNLIYRYAELIDAGDFAAVAELFAAATVTVEGTDDVRTGAADVLDMYTTSTRRYDDNGTPHTKHLTTNLILDVDDEAGTASCRSYVTVFQATDALPLQPIYAGRYRDTFVRAGDAWRFATRRIVGEYRGDMSAHVLHPAGEPGDTPQRQTST